MEMTGAKAYLVNTGWNGSGKRISIKDTRGSIDAMLLDYFCSFSAKFINKFFLSHFSQNTYHTRLNWNPSFQFARLSSDLANRLHK